MGYHSKQTSIKESHENYRVNNSQARKMRGNDIIPFTVEEIDYVGEYWVKRLQSEVEVDLELQAGR
mgnify:CR=1 FL=1